MSAVSESGNPVGAAPAAGVSARAAGLALLAVIVLFAAAFAIGSVAKKSTTPSTPAGQLATPSALQGKSSVQVSLGGAAASVPALAHVNKPKPKSKPQSSSSQAAASSASSSSPTTASNTASSASSQPSNTPSSAPVSQPTIHNSPAPTPSPAPAPAPKPSPTPSPVVVSGG